MRNYDLDNCVLRPRICRCPSGRRTQLPESRPHLPASSFVTLQQSSCRVWRRRAHESWCRGTVAGNVPDRAPAIFRFRNHRVPRKESHAGSHRGNVRRCGRCILRSAARRCYTRRVHRTGRRGCNQAAVHYRIYDYYPTALRNRHRRWNFRVSGGPRVGNSPSLHPTRFCIWPLPSLLNQEQYLGGFGGTDLRSAFQSAFIRVHIFVSTSAITCTLDEISKDPTSIGVATAAFAWNDSYW